MGPVILRVTHKTSRLLLSHLKALFKIELLIEKKMSATENTVHDKINQNS